jgi:large subunit ribosomal protein L1
MSIVSKRRKKSSEKYDVNKVYSLFDACSVIKDINNGSKFDESVDLAMRLGVDPTKPNQMIRGVVSLPHGTGKDVKVLVICDADKHSEAKEAGADFYGLDEYLEKIKNGWVDFDVLITSPNFMPKIGPLGRVLGPRSLMPNPKTGTVTDDIAKAVKAVKSGKIDFKVDKFGIIHSAFGKASFDANKLSENANELIQTIVKLKPNSLKGTYVKSVSISSTMSSSVKIDLNKIL